MSKPCPCCARADDGQWEDLCDGCMSVALGLGGSCKHSEDT